MSEPKPIYRTNGEWMAFLFEGNLFDTMGEWIGWLDADDVFSLDGEYVGYIGTDSRLLRPRLMPYRKRRRPPQHRPHCKRPQSVPLPPMFAELSYSTVDVFEEEPDFFAMINELRPDAGEKPLPRLADTIPSLALQKQLQRVEREVLEEMVYGLVFSYGTTEPPVPVEAIAVGVEASNIGDVETASPQKRLRFAEELIERLGRSGWAMDRGYCGQEGFTPAQVEYAARALLVPRHWILQTPAQLRRPWAVAHRYNVSGETAVLRLHDLE